MDFMPPRIDLPAVLPTDAEPAPPHTPLLPERTDFLEGDAPAAAKVEAFLARALEATGSNANITAGALVPWICDALLSNHSVKAYGRDLMDFVRHMQAQGVTPLEVTADHVRLYKRALLEAGMKSATVARRLSVLRGAYKQLAAKGLVSWETAQDIAAVKAPGVQKNSTPSLTQRQAIALLEAIPSDTLQGIRDLALMSVFFITGCRVSAVTGACVGHLETDGVEHYLNVTEKRNKKRRKILLDAARPVLAYMARAGIGDDKEGPLFRPMRPRRGRAGAAAPGPQDPLAAGEEVLRGGWYRAVAVRESWNRYSFAPQDRHQRRDQKWSDDARGAGVRRARGYQDDRGLLRA
jgi:integrase